MSLRLILSRICKQRIVNFRILTSGIHSLATAENATSMEEKSLEKAYIVSYLVNSCGLSQEKAVSASKKVHFYGPFKPNAVLDFLEKQGFSKSQIAELVARLPKILVANPEKSLLPKIESLLHSTGISEKEVLSTVSRFPNLYLWSSGVGHVYDYIKDIVGAEKVDTLLRRGSWIFKVDVENRLIPNVDFLTEIGVPKQSIELALSHFPKIFMSKHVELREIVEEVKQMGFDQSKSTFILAIHARTGKRSIDLWNQCYEVYSKWGWSRDDIYMAFRKHPNCMLLSEKKISTVMDFLVNEVGREPRSVAGCPHILLLSMEKRIVPRCSIVHLLSLKGLVKKDWSLNTVLLPVEKKFLDEYVTRYSDELPQLYNIYLSKKVGVTKA